MQQASTVDLSFSTCNHGILLIWYYQVFLQILEYIIWGNSHSHQQPNRNIRWSLPIPNSITSVLSHLGHRSSKKIWANFFEPVRHDENSDVNLDELSRHLDELAELEINSRQIRNMWKTARDWAQYKKETLDWEHLELAIKPVGDFTKYLQNVHGHTDEQWAREEKLR